MENLCLICKKEIADGENTIACVECGKTYHTKCWKMTGCCADAECRERTNAKKEAERKEKIFSEKKAAEEKASAGKEKIENNESQKSEVLTQEKLEVKGKNKKEKRKKHIIIAASILLVYTVLVSTISINAYKSYLRKEIEDAFSFEDSILDNTADSAEKENKKKQKSSEKLSIGQSATVDGMFEIKIEKSEWKEKIEPSDKSNVYSYIEDTEGEKYFIVWASVKNISSRAIDLSYNNGKCSAFINGKYKLDGNIAIEESDGTGFYGGIKPLQTSRVAFYVSVPDEMYDSFEIAEIYLDLINNEESIDSFNSTENNYDSFVLTLKNG